MTMRDAFERDGLVRVPGAIDPHDVTAMRDHVTRTLTDLRFVELSGALRPAPGSEPLLWEIGRAPAFAPLPAALARAADAVFGPGVWTPTDERGGLAAPNLPLPGAPWTVPYAAWHVDEPTAAAHAASWGLLGFACLDRIDPGGGATVAIAGSHRRLLQLAATLAPPAGMLTTDLALAALAAEPWFAALLSPDRDAATRALLDQPHLSAGISLRVIELTGEPGDLLLMDPRCLHTVSANASSRPRLTMRLVCARA